MGNNEAAKLWQKPLGREASGKGCLGRPQDTEKQGEEEGGGRRVSWQGRWALLSGTVFTFMNFREFHFLKAICILHLFS